MWVSTNALAIATVALVTALGDGVDRSFACCCRCACASGAYQIRFCKGGKWIVVTIDDFLPVDPETNRLVFSHSPNNELWVSLIEKAYARLHGSYAAIESGSICDAFVDLTGAPAERIDLHVDEMSKFAADKWTRNCGGDPAQARQILWATILSFRQSKFLMGASCGRRGVSADEYKRVGLRSDHVRDTRKRSRHSSVLSTPLC